MKIILSINSLVFAFCSFFYFNVIQAAVVEIKAEGHSEGKAYPRFYTIDRSDYIYSSKSDAKNKGRMDATSELNCDVAKKSLACISNGGGIKNIPQKIKYSYSYGSDIAARVWTYANTSLRCETDPAASVQESVAENELKECLEKLEHNIYPLYLSSVSKELKTAPENLFYPKQARTACLLSIGNGNEYELMNCLKKAVGQNVQNFSQALNSCTFSAYSFYNAAIPLSVIQACPKKADYTREIMLLHNYFVSNKLRPPR